jgi:hypothetical protein
MLKDFPPDVFHICGDTDDYGDILAERNGNEIEKLDESKTTDY